MRGSEREKKDEKKQKRARTKFPLGESAFLQIIPLFSLLSSNFLMLDKGGAKFFRFLNKTVGMSRRQKIFVQNQNVALAHLCCLCASSRRVRDTRRRNARAGEEGCENKE